MVNKTKTTKAKATKTPVSDPSKTKTKTVKTKTKTKRKSRKVVKSTPKPEPELNVTTPDSADELEIGYGTVAETDERLTIGGGVAETIITLGDATTAEDISLNFDGNAVDFHFSLDDSEDEFEIGFGTTIETDERITIMGSAT